MPITNGTSTVTVVEEETDLKEPDEYKVIMLNDDFTTQDFVVAVIISIFNKALYDAMRIMLDIHHSGRGIVGIFPYDIAVTKIDQVHSLAKQNGFPLKCTMEKV